MDAVSLIQRLHQHKAWVNANLLQTATVLSPDQLRRSFPIGQGSVWKSLVHLYAAEYVWLGALHGDEEPLVPGDVRGKIPGNQLGEGGLTDLNDLAQKWSGLELRWSEYLASLTAEQLDETVYKRISITPGVRLGSRRSDILLHVCTHAQYTTAQVINMLRQLNVSTLPDVMLISMARQEVS